MPILTKEVEVRVNSKTAGYYESLGYEIPMKKASESTRKKHKKDYVYDIGKTFMVKVDDLLPSSNMVVDYLCDYCLEEVMRTVYANLTIGTQEIDKMACKKCYPQKVKEVCLLRYGVDNYAKTDEFHEKYTDAMLAKYGVEHNSQLPDYREKFHSTCVERYGESYYQQFAEKSRNSFREKTGYDHPLQSPEIKEKSKQTCLDKYGYEYVLQVPEVREKITQSCIEHYGVDHPNKSFEVRAKTAQTLYGNGTTLTSKQQLYIFNLYNSDGKAELNFPVFCCPVDICLPEEKIAIEYDGGGHDLRVALRTMTQEEFDHKELVREKIIKKEGYRIIRIKSKIDLLPSDSTLLQMLEEAKQYFSQYPNHSWIQYDIDVSIVRNAEHKDGTPYDFGELRKISSADVDVHNVA